MDSRDDIAHGSIKPLNAINYAIWSKKMQLLLRSKGLWNIVKGKKKSPAETSEAAYLKFLQRRHVALADILLSIEESCSHSVISLEDPKEVLDKLSEMFKNISDTCLDVYLTKLQNIKMKDGEKMIPYVTRLIEFENELAIVGHSLQEKEKKAPCCAVSGKST